MRVAQGKSKKLMSPAACVNFYSFTKTLHKWEDGVPVDCGTNRMREQIEAGIQQGAHLSAMTTEAIALIEEDVAYQVQGGYGEFVDWEWLKGRILAQLKVSPLAVLQQKTRRGCMILDLLFPVLRQANGQGRKKSWAACEVLHNSVNNSKWHSWNRLRNWGMCSSGCCVSCRRCL
jgi:hypothetical protein